MTSNHDIPKQCKKAFFSTCLFLLCVAGCGSKNSVDDNETPPSGPGKSDGRSRLTGGFGQNQNNSGNDCKFPLDLGTVADPRRPGLNQSVLSSQIDNKCAGYQEIRVTFKTRQRITFLGKFNCRSGIQYNEQVCTGPAKDLISSQKTAINIPIIADENLNWNDLEASVEFF